MFKRKERRTAAAVRIAIAIAPLAACDGSIETAAAKQADDFSSVSSVSSITSGNSMRSLPVADFAIPAQVAAIEHHHFDAYTSYHAAFDGTPMLRLEDGFSVPVIDRQNPGISFDGSHLPETIQTCSLRTLLLLD